MLQAAKKKSRKLTDHGKQLLPRALQISNVIVFYDTERIMGNDMGERGVGKDINSIIKCFFVYYSLLGVFCTENIIRKKWSSTEQASNETVAKTSWRYLFANPHRYIRATDQ